MKFLRFVEVTLSVPSIEETAEWYQRVLGWKYDCDAFDEDGKCRYGSVSGAENCSFNLSRSHSEDISQVKGQPNVTFYIHVDDVDAVYKKVSASGWKTNDPPENQFWGGRTFIIQDLNGFNLMFLQIVEHPSLEEVRRRLHEA